MYTIEKTQRISALIASAEVWRIDEWRQQQFPLISRTAAIRELLKIGLKASTPKEQATKRLL